MKKFRTIVELPLIPKGSESVPGKEVMKMRDVNHLPNLNDNAVCFLHKVSSPPSSYASYSEGYCLKNPQWFEEIKEPERFKVGQYITPINNSNSIFYIREVVPGGYNGDWYSESGSAFNPDSGLRDSVSGPYRLATNEEIEKYLILEAKRRGFVKGATFIRPKSSGFSESKITARDDNYRIKIYNDDVKLMVNGYFIYLNGEWGTIIKEKEYPAKLGSHEVTFQAGKEYVSVGCHRYDFNQVSELYNTLLKFKITNFGIEDTSVKIEELEQIYYYMTSK